MELFRLFGSIFVDNEEANKSIFKTDEKAKGLGSRLSSGITTAVKWGAAIAGGAAVAGGALLGVATKAAESTDRIDKMSQKIGISRKGFQEWDFILSQSGASVDGLQTGFKTFVTQIDAANSGTKKSAEAFNQLGISLTDTNGKVKDQEALFNEIVSALQNMDDGVQKAALANQLLGRSGTELMPLLNGAAGSIDEMRQKANELGLVIGDDAVNAGVKFTDTMDQMKRSLGAIITNIGAGVMPIIQGFFDWIMQNMPIIQAVFKTVFDAVGVVITTVGDIFKTYIIPTLQELFAWIKPKLPAIQQIFETVFNAAKEVLGIFINTVKSVIDWLKQWADDNSEMLDNIEIAFMDIFDSIQILITEFISIVTEIWSKYGDDIVLILQTAWDLITGIISTAVSIIADIFNIFAAAFQGDWEGVWNHIKWLFSDIWNGIENILNNGLNVIKSAFSLFGNVLNGIWNDIWNGIVSGLKSAINLIIDNINSMITKVVSGINKVTGIINKIPGVNIPTVSTPQIPKLAEGGTITRSGSVLVGEEAPEILSLPIGARVTPLDRAEVNQHAKRNNNITNQFTISSLVVREEADIKKIAKELYDLQRANSRGLGVVT